ncbi:MAG: two-component regulator propeller domain-containing protein [Bacteroidales bacterium]|nr:two-component regulator propeller domain-containing protein [Bacteroidales bacterium]
MKRLLFYSLLSFIALSSFAQQAVGEWKSYPAFGNITAVTPAGPKVFAVSLGNIFSFDTEDNNLEIYTRENGISDISAQKMAYDEKRNLLVIVYANSDIDIIDGKELYNLPDLMNKSLTSSKVVNDIYFDEKYAYLSTDFGVMVVNMEKKEIADTYMLGVKVKNTIVHDNHIYALSEKGIYIASLADNLLDIHNWKIMDAKTGDKLLYFDGKFHLLVAKTAIYTFQPDNSWATFKSGTILDMMLVNDKLVYRTAKTVAICSTDKSIVTSTTPFEMVTLQHASSTNSYWASVNGSGLLSFKIQTDGTVELVNQPFLPDGPMTNVPFFMSYSQKRLMMAGGGRWGNRYFTKGSIMLYEGDKWLNYNVDSIRDLTNKIDYMDIVSLVADPNDRNHLFAASCGDGLYEFKDHKLVKLHTFTNSALESALPTNNLNYQYVRVDALSYDEDQNLWMSNYLVDSTLRVLKSDSTWLSLTYPDLKKKATISQINHMSNGDKWIILPRNVDECGLFVLDIKGDLEDVSKHRTVYFHSFTDMEGKIIYPNGVFCAVEDKNGTIWVGTDKGPLLFPNPKKVFNANFRCTRVKVPLEEESESTGGTVAASYLLENEQLNCIAIDGGNRKWIGTEGNGVYLLSENGKKTIHHFTKENSPLLSNRILSLAINPDNGEVFIGTESGLVSFMGDAIEGKEDYSDAYAFPNPVAPDFEGPIVVRGLMENSEVIITDVQGRKIFTGVSLGGEISWNGKDGNDNRVSSGVYLVYAATPDGKKGVVTKIVMIK